MDTVSGDLLSTFTKHIVVVQHWVLIAEYQFQVALIEMVCYNRSVKVEVPSTNFCDGRNWLSA
jgi:hypothetical protein